MARPSLRGGMALPWVGSLYPGVDRDPQAVVGRLAGRYLDRPQRHVPAISTLGTKMTNTAPLRLAIFGAAGRMGRRLVALAHDDPALSVTLGIGAPGEAALGTDVGVLAGVGEIGVPLVASDALTDEAAASVLIDFSLPDGHRAARRLCETRGMAMVVGTTGLTDADHAALDELATRVAVMQAPNMSVGVNLLFALVGRVASQLGEDYDIEIVEAHHRHKKDAPSGTAMGLAEAIVEATGRSITDDLTHGRSGEQPRRPGEIGMHAVRLGDVVGRHDVYFGTPGEEIVISHTASTRDVFARGALRAAKWLAQQPAGRYTMLDVLGIG